MTYFTNIEINFAYVHQSSLSVPPFVLPSVQSNRLSNPSIQSVCPFFLLVCPSSLSAPPARASVLSVCQVQSIRSFPSVRLNQYICTLCPVRLSVRPFDRSIRPVRPPVHLIHPFVCLICLSGGLKEIRNGDLF